MPVTVTDLDLMIETALETIALTLPVCVYYPVLPPLGTLPERLIAFTHLSAAQGNLASLIEHLEEAQTALGVTLFNADEGGDEEEEEEDADEDGDEEEEDV
jgi:hypothetical protein